MPQLHHRSETNDENAVENAISSLLVSVGTDVVVVVVTSRYSTGIKPSINITRRQ